MATTENIYKAYVTYETDNRSKIIKLRKEQKDAVKAAKTYFEKSKEHNRFLWNAKMRFGKTFCAMQLAIEMGESQIDPSGKKDSKPISRVLIITHRPVVQGGFAEDLNKLQDSLKSQNKLNREWSFGTRFENDGPGDFDKLERDAAHNNKPYVFFSSTQWLNYSKEAGGAIDDPLRKRIILNNWDLIVIDEAHEGIIALRGSKLVEALERCNPKMLYMSGTPFNLLEGTQGFASDQIFSWDYIEEQKMKNEWNKKYPDKTNPYQELPKMNIFAFDMGKLIPGTDYKKGDSFRFKELFRVYEGRPEVDMVKVDGSLYQAKPEEVGKFIHEDDVKKFIRQMYEGSDGTNYPYTNQQYQENFRHTLWIVPGVKAAKALKEVLEKDEIFGSDVFRIVNVAGNNDEDEKTDDLGRVREAIASSDYTITISCGKLTTGVTVPEWTAVFYMKGSADTSPATYMQTIFRVQSPHIFEENGEKHMKSNCYVFDFAPGRSLKVVAATAKFARTTQGVGRNSNIMTQNDEEVIENFTTYCPIWQPVVAKEGSSLKPIDTQKIIEELNKVYVENIVKNGFDDYNIYLNEEILGLSDEIIQQTKEINENIPGENSGDKNSSTTTQISEDGGINTSGGGKPKKPKQSDIEKWKSEMDSGKTIDDFETWMAKKEEEKKQQEKLNATRKLIHAITKRIPLLMFGAEVEDENIGITVDNITEQIDDDSWNEFMPKGATKEYFKKIKHCYNDSMFKKAGTLIRQMAIEADEMHIEERIKRIADIFNYFKNPDKETVLTPWKVVNRHMSDTLGGFCFFDENFKETSRKPIMDENGDIVKDENGSIKYSDTIEPREITASPVHQSIFYDLDENNGESRVKILEINSKTGLYPLYAAYSIYRPLLEVYKSKHGIIDDPDNISISEERAIWNTVIKNNVYVICNTDMAARITYRTLIGHNPPKDIDVSTISVNHRIKGLHIISDKLVSKAIENSMDLAAEIRSPKYWNENTSEKKEMKFDAIIGNPPYQVADGGNSNSASPIYQYFVDIAKKLEPSYVSMIMPARWYVGGKGLDHFRKTMLKDRNIKHIYDYPDYRELFPSAEIAGGVCYFLMDLKDDNKDSTCTFTSVIKGIQDSCARKLDEYEILLRDNKAPKIIEKIKNLKINEGKCLNRVISPRKPFGIQTDYRPQSSGTPCWFKQSYGLKFADPNDIKDSGSFLNKWKLLIPRAPIAGQTDFTKPISFYSESNVRIAKPGECCAEVYLVACAFDTKKEVENFKSYLFTKTVRYLILQCVASQDVTRECFMFVPDLGKYDEEITDSTLIQKWDITNTEWEHIKTKIK